MKKIATEHFLSNPRVLNFVIQDGIILSYKNEGQVLRFSKILEIAIGQGRWWGQVSEVS